MARWMLDCHDCHKKFTHSEISSNGHSQLLDPFIQDWEIKPEFPNSGQALVCPNCLKSATYQRHELVIQAS